MNRKLALLALLAAFGLAAVPAGPALAAGEDAAAQAEKEKALKNPYPNDFGPEKLADLKGYTAEQQQGYKLMLDKCARCHTPSRPLNSQFIDVKPDELTALKSKQPELFKNKKVWQIESGIWQRYVKRMMAKPGCNIPNEEGKKIFKFLLEYSKREKTGANAAKWAASRKKLLEDFEKKYPARYKELFASN